MPKRFAPIVAALFLVLPLSADHFDVFTISPTSGPSDGGNTVTLSGNFDNWPYGVVFGHIPAISVERVDEHTIVAVVPPNLPGRVNVRVFQYDLLRGNAMGYTYEGDVPESLERFLVPIYVPPVKGAYGSEFRTDFRAREKEPTGIVLFGVHTRDSDVLSLGHSPLGYGPRRFVYDGTPGRFFYVNDEHAQKFSTNLRVYDTSQADENHGTEIPVVHESEFDQRLLLLGIPTDPRYRSTLRIYGVTPGAVTVKVGETEPVTLYLKGAADVYEPAYAQFTAFPIGTETLDVQIESESAVWAFVSVTNNETQLISTITPQP